MSLSIFYPNLILQVHETVFFDSSDGDIRDPTQLSLDASNNKQENEPSLEIQVHSASMDDGSQNFESHQPEEPMKENSSNDAKFDKTNQEEEETKKNQSVVSSIQDKEVRASLVTNLN